MPSSSEEHFRDSLRSFRWGSNNNNNNNNNGNISLPTNKNTTPFSRLTDTTSNFFGSVSNRVQGYNPLNNTQEEDEWFTLTRWQRLTGFGVCLLAAALCFLIAFLTIPLLALKPRKFAVTYTMGSLFVLTSFALLHGPMAHLRHILSMQRLPFTFAYLGSMIATLYFAVGLHSYILTIIFSIIQVLALIWYVVSYFPGGVGTLQFGSRVFANQASNILPF
ncbi:hypothetical protein G9A89_017157 [Geosiphon pyriformis]|nr:hypothetical protein G9A89_017157 [Geosiphon pyriformis]